MQTQSKNVKCKEDYDNCKIVMKRDWVMLRTCKKVFGLHRELIVCSGRHIVIYVVLILLIILSACEDEVDLNFWDIKTGWDKDAGNDVVADISTDTSLNLRFYEYACSEITQNVVSAEGVVYFDGEIPDTARLSVAITTKPPPGMPTCFFTVKAKEFPFGFKFTNLERDTEVYVMAVLKMDGATIPIPKEGVDYYGDYGKVPIKLTQDIKNIEIYLRLYKKE